MSIYSFFKLSNHILFNSSSIRSDNVGSVSYARKFHQFLIVGLIEACKGISELFPEAIGSADTDVVGSGTGTGTWGRGSACTSVTAAVTAADVVSAADAYTQLQVL